MSVPEYYEMDLTKDVGIPSRQYHTSETLASGSGKPHILPVACKVGITLIPNSATGAVDVTTDSPDKIRAGTATFVLWQADSSTPIYKEFEGISGFRGRITSGTSIYISACAKHV